MLYIEKEGLPKDISQKTIELSKSEEWKSIDKNNTDAIRRVFDNDFPKNVVPLSRDKDKAIDYNNMFGVCDGGERITGEKEHILCCDAHKKETEISTSPLDKVQMEKMLMTELER